MVSTDSTSAGLPAIQAFVFDLDDTLVYTEHLKAQSYARALRALIPDQAKLGDFYLTSQRLVGRTREEMARSIVHEFNLDDLLRDTMTAIGVDEPWEALVHLRMKEYRRLIDNPVRLRKRARSHVLDLVTAAKEARLLLGLASMSHRSQIDGILGSLGLGDTFDFIASCEDVSRGKPDPEIYRLIAGGLGLAPAHCLVFEDSLVGVRAALKAGMQCIAVPTDLTVPQFDQQRDLAETWIVKNPVDLGGTVNRKLNSRGPFGVGVGPFSQR